MVKISSMKSQVKNNIYTGELNDAIPEYSEGPSKTFHISFNISLK